MPLKVKSRPNESIDQMLRRLRKSCEREGIIREFRRHEFYEKPCEVRSRKKRQRIRKSVKQGKKFIEKVEHRKIDRRLPHFDNPLSTM